MYNSYEPCENSWYLREREYQEDIINQNWLATLPEKREQIVEHSISLLEGFTFQEEWEWAFNSFLNNDKTCERLYIVLDDWNTGDVSPEDEDFLNEIALAALEASSQILFDTELYEIADEGGFKISKMIIEVLE